MMPAPRWLLRKIAEAGPQGRGAYRLEAQTGACPSCAAPVLTGLDGGGYDADLADEAMTGPRPVTTTGEAWALMNGLRTYRLRAAGNVITLHRRDSLTIGCAPVGAASMYGPITVVIEHRCGMNIPAAFLQGE